MIPSLKSFIQRSIDPIIYPTIFIIFAAFLAFYFYFLFLLTRLFQSWMHSTGAYLAEVAHTAYHETQVKVLRPHHGVQLEVLYAHRRWMILNGTLTFGELFMALGTLVLAASALKRARVVYILDRGERPT
jgi:hypothetical protein